MTTCSYRFPEDHPDATDGAEWDCPHTAVEGVDRCVFHLDPDERTDQDVSAGEVVQRLLEVAESSGEELKRVRGARLDGLDLRHALVEADDNYPIDLSHAVIDGDLDLRHAHIGQPLVLDSAVVHGRLLGGTARFEGYVDMQATEFRGHVDLGDAVFKGQASFRDAVFAGTDSSERYPGFVASFRNARFEDAAVFYGSRFEGRLDMRNTTLEDGIFHGATLDTAFFGGAEIRTAAFTALRALEDSAFVSFRNATLDRGVLNQAYVVEDGSIRYPDESIYYNLEKAAVGAVRLKPDADGELFRYFRILETEWDGFDFADYEQFLAPGWDLHSYDGPVLQEGNITSTLVWTHEDDPADLEMTYLKAKKGAELAGDDRAASEFFVNQMEHREDQHRERLRSATGWGRISAASTYLGSRLMGLVSGHGQRPWRVIGTSMAIIAVCTVLYPFGGLVNGGSVISYGSEGLLTVVGKALYFSTTTFTTLGLGDIYPASVGGQVLAGFESLAGALLMALLVFVLGRRA